MENEWHSYKDYNPTNDKVDIKLIDGSILRNVWWQNNREFYWRCKPNGEMFVCDFSVTHWRLPQTEAATCV